MFSVASAPAQNTTASVRNEPAQARHSTSTKLRFLRTPRLPRSDNLVESCEQHVVLLFAGKVDRTTQNSTGIQEQNSHRRQSAPKIFCVLLPARRRHKTRQMAAANNAARLAPSACVHCSTARHGHPWLDVGEGMDESARKCVFVLIATKLA